MSPDEYAAYVRELVDAAPPLREDQLAVLREAFAPQQATKATRRRRRATGATKGRKAGTGPATAA